MVGGSGELGASQEKQQITWDNTENIKLKKKKKVLVNFAIVDFFWHK